MLKWNRSRPRNMPRKVTWKDSLYYYDGVSDVTGDVFYLNVNDHGVESRLLVTNPHARIRQLSYRG